MIDSALIKDNYSRMSDEQLIRLAQTEGQNIMGDALTILREEFLNRKLDTAIFETIDDNKTAQQKHNIQQAQDNASNEFLKSIWADVFDEKEKGTTDEEIHKGLIERGLDEEHSSQIIKTLKSKAKQVLDTNDNASKEFIKSIWDYVFDEKEKGTTDEEIHKGLIERGFDEEHSSLIIETLESKAKQVLDAYDRYMIRNGIIFAAGLMITVWTYTSAINGGTYVIAWGAIIFGAIRFFRGLSNKRKYKTILENIETERDVDETTAK